MQIKKKTQMQIQMQMKMQIQMQIKIKMKMQTKKSTDGGQNSLFSYTSTGEKNAEVRFNSKEKILILLLIIFFDKGALQFN